jgi:hypothetical protein
MLGIHLAAGVFLAALVSATSLAAGFPPDEAIVDTLSLPRLPGAVPDPSRAESHSSVYSAPGSVAAVTAATRQLLMADGWQPYVDPLEDMRRGGMQFKKGIQGLILSFTMSNGKADQSRVHYIAERVATPLPFPADATLIVYDNSRPYLHLVTAGAPDATLKFYLAELAAMGWKPLSEAAAAARWPNAKLDNVHIYYTRGRSTIQLALEKRSDGTVGVDVRIPPFAQPALQPKKDMAGLPVPEPNNVAQTSGSSDSVRRALKVGVQAELLPVLEFYRREMASRNWTEAPGAVVTAGEAAATFTSPEGTAALKLTTRYDSTIVSLVVEAPRAVVEAKLKAKREADEKFVRDIMERDRAELAALKAKQAAEETAARLAKAKAAGEDLEPEETSGLPVPKKHTLSSNGTTADQGSQTPFRRDLIVSVPANLDVVLAFYRRELGKRKWQELPQSAIVKPDKVALAFAAPDGPAMLKLGRANGETTVSLIQKIPAEAAKSGLLPAPGRAKLMFGNIGDAEAAIVINAKTLKMPPGTGGPNSPHGPTFELPPGKYKYVVKVAGRPDRVHEVTVAANDAWGVMVGPGGDGVLALQMY